MKKITKTSKTSAIFFKTYMLKTGQRWEQNRLFYFKLFHALQILLTLKSLFFTSQNCPTWSAWSAFGDCSVSCGNGTKTRRRNCDNGDIGDIGCHDGIPLDFETCNEQVYTATSSLCWKGVRKINLYSKLKGF